MTKDEALDLALEALESFDGVGDVVTWEKQWKLCFDAITAIKQARALDKKAENARELRLDYEPAEVLGHNGWGFPIEAAAPVQETIATDWSAVHKKLELVWYRELSADEGLDEIQDLIDTTPPNVATPLAAQRPVPEERKWVELTDEEINRLWRDSKSNIGFEDFDVVAKEVEAQIIGGLQ